MTVLIIEDETGSAAKLEQYLKALRPEMKLVGKLESIRQSIAFLQTQAEPDLIFLDIQLSDGTSFEIFREVQIDSYVIFLTAYDAYAIRAFELNSIDYLLKPFTREDIAGALKKLDKIRYNRHNLQALIDRQRQQTYRQRFLVSKGRRMYTLRTDEVAYFIRKSVLFLMTTSGEEYLYDASLDELESQLDPAYFFRVNRHCIIHYGSIDSIQRASSNRLQLQLKPAGKQEIFVSQGNLTAFKNWLVR